MGARNSPRNPGTSNSASRPSTPSITYSTIRLQPLEAFGTVTGPLDTGQRKQDQTGENTMPKSETEDAADILDIALSSLYDIPPIAFSTSSPSALHTYNPPNNHQPVHLRLPNPSAEVYTKLQANHLWLAAIYLADLIHLGQIPIEGQRIAELGAAAGLPGVSACRLGAEVVGTDWGDQGILDALEDNFKRSCPDGRYAVRAHEWGSDPAPLLSALGEEVQFDRLLLADTLWVTEAHSALLDSIWSLLKPGGTAHVAAGLHTGRGPLQRFITAAEARGATIINRREVFWKSEGEWLEGTRSSSGLEEERGVVVYFELVRH